MNGRIYDPLMGRFMSADPFIQAPFELQSHNRYAYVMNNPLGLTDPSGYLFGINWVSFRDNVAKPVAIIVVAYYTGGAAANAMGFTGATAGASMGLVTTGAGATLGSAIAVGAASGFAAGFTATALYGGNLEQAFKAGTMGAITGGAMGAVSFGVSGFDMAGRIATKSFATGAMAKVQGGNFADAVRRTLITSTAAEAYTKFTGFNATPEAGENQAADGAACGESGSSCFKTAQLDNNDKIPTSWENKNTVGMNREPLSDKDSAWTFKQSGPISRALNAVPMINATSKLHDTLFLRGGFDLSFNTFTNVSTMLPSAAVTFGALIDRIPAADRSRCPGCYR
jgi:hypothetical protein